MSLERLQSALEATKHSINNIPSNSSHGFPPPQAPFKEVSIEGKPTSLVRLSIEGKGGILEKIPTGLSLEFLVNNIGDINFFRRHALRFYPTTRLDQQNYVQYDGTIIEPWQEKKLTFPMAYSLGLTAGAEKSIQEADTIGFLYAGAES